MSQLEISLAESILAIGLSVIAYFLKLIHSDVRTAIVQLQQQETKLAVGAKTFQELEKRIETMSDDRERRLSALESAVFKKGV
jgi:cell division protein FtsB